MGLIGINYMQALWRRKWQPTPVFLPGELHGQTAWQAAALEEMEQLLEI